MKELFIFFLGMVVNNLLIYWKIKRIEKNFERENKNG